MIVLFIFVCLQTHNVYLKPKIHAAHNFVLATYCIITILK